MRADEMAQPAEAEPGAGGLDHEGQECPRRQPRQSFGMTCFHHALTTEWTTACLEAINSGLAID